MKRLSDNWNGSETMSKKKPKVKAEVTEEGNLVFTLPFIRTRKGTKAKPSIPHKDKKKEDKRKHKSE